MILTRPLLFALNIQSVEALKRDRGIPKRCLYRQNTLEFDIQNRRAHINRIVASLENPVLLLRTPDTQIPPCKWKAEGLGLPRSQELLLKASQLLWR